MRYPEVRKAREGIEQIRGSRGFALADHDLQAAELLRLLELQQVAIETLNDRIEQHLLGGETDHPEFRR